MPRVQLPHSPSTPMKLAPTPKTKKHCLPASPPFFLALAALLLPSACDRPQSSSDPETIERLVADRVSQALREERLAQAETQIAEREQELREREQLLRDRERQLRDAAITASAQPSPSPSPTPQLPTPTPSPSRQGWQSPPPTAYETFYEPLAAYGQWFEVPTYGVVWQPSTTYLSPTWQPYTLGSWFYTDVGWTWISDEPFGWAVYHYGRWIYFANFGWCWVPDLEWGPSWVSWVVAESHIGWAPLPPGTSFSTSKRRISTGFVADLGPAHYCFVPVHDFGAPRINTVVVDRSQNISIIQNTVNVTNIIRSGDTIINQGPSFENIRTHSRYPIRTARLERRPVDAITSRPVRVEPDRIQVEIPTLPESQSRLRWPRSVQIESRQALERRTGWEDIADRSTRDRIQSRLAASQDPPVSWGALTEPEATSPSLEEIRSTERSEPGLSARGEVTPADSTQPIASEAVESPAQQAKEPTEKDRRAESSRQDLGDRRRRGERPEQTLPPGDQQAATRTPEADTTLTHEEPLIGEEPPPTQTSSAQRQQRDRPPSQRQAEERARKQQEQAQRQAEEQARKQQEEAQRQAEEQARRQQEEAQRQVEEQARRQQKEAQRQAEEQARRQQEQAQRQAEEQARRQQEQAQRQAEEQARRQQEQAQRQAEEEARRQSE